VIKWEKEAVNAPIIARYSLGFISLGKLAKELRVTTLEAMQLLQGAGYQSPYSYEDYVDGKKTLERLNYGPSKSGKHPAKAKAGKRTRK